MSWKAVPVSASCLFHILPHHTKTAPEEHLEHLFPGEQCGPSLHVAGIQHISVQQMNMCQPMSLLGMIEAESNGVFSEHLYLLVLRGGHYYDAIYRCGK